MNNFKEETLMGIVKRSFSVREPVVGANRRETRLNPPRSCMAMSQCRF